MNKPLIPDRKKRYRQILLPIFLFFALVVILDAVMGRLLEHYYYTQTSGLQFRTTNAVDKTRAEVLIFGSSRANHHYQPDVFEAVLRRTYYNAGRDGNFIFYHYAVLSAVLKRYRPKIIILDFMSGEFAWNQSSYDRLSSLLPYYERHPEMRPMIALKSPFEKVKLWSRIYPYNSALFTIAAGNTAFNKKRRTEVNGYVALNSVMNSGYEPAAEAVPRYETDSNKLLMFRRFLADCHLKNIELYIVCSPYFNRPPGDDYSLTLAKKMAGTFNVRFLDHSRDVAFSGHTELFADRLHLNDRGARQFSRLITAEILLYEGLEKR